MPQGRGAAGRGQVSSLGELINAGVRVPPGFALTTEGYRVGNPIEGRRGAVTVLPLSNANQMLVFANDTRLFERALYWIRQLARAAAIGNGEGVFVYAAQNTSAEDLATLVAQASSGDANAPQATPPEISVRRTGGVRTGAQAEPAASSAMSIGGLTVGPF